MLLFREIFQKTVRDFFVSNRDYAFLSHFIHFWEHRRPKSTNRLLDSWSYWSKFVWRLFFPVFFFNPPRNMIYASGEIYNYLPWFWIQIEFQI